MVNDITRNVTWIWMVVVIPCCSSDYSNYDENIDIDAGNKIAIKRTGDAFELLVNDVVKYSFVDKSSGEGYIFHGHYNSNTAQCFSDPTLLTSASSTASTSSKLKGGWWYGDCLNGENKGGLATWSSTPAKSSTWMGNDCTALEAKHWESGHDFISSGGSRYGCSPGNNDNKITPMKDLVQGNFEYSLVVDYYS